VAVFIQTGCRRHLKCDGTRAETRFRLSAKRTSQFKSAGASVQSTTGSRDVRIRGSNAGCSMFRGNVKSNGYPLHSPVFPFTSPPGVTVCHYISTGLYLCWCCLRAGVVSTELKYRFRDAALCEKYCSSLKSVKPLKNNQVRTFRHNIPAAKTCNTYLRWYQLGRTSLPSQVL
jgi:hypothetical protein